MVLGKPRAVGSRQNESASNRTVTIDSDTAYDKCRRRPEKQDDNASNNTCTAIRQVLLPMPASVCEQ